MIMPIDNINNADNSEQVTSKGVLQNLEIFTTGKLKDKMCTFDLVDENKKTEVLVFPEVFSKIEGRIKAGITVEVKGRIESERGEKRLIAEKVVVLG
ncbi:OB-fold nucleic acid binding domain-containing protein [Verrucomicrobiota bacterium]